MSETHIVNRTQPSFGQQLEAERLEAQTAPEVESVLPGTEFEKLPVQVRPALPATEGVNRTIFQYDTLTPAPEATQAPAEKPAEQQNVLVVPETPFNPIAALISELMKGRKEFEQKVIAAFKHMGLDTAKHFGV